MTRIQNVMGIWVCLLVFLSVSHAKESSKKKDAQVQKTTAESVSESLYHLDSKWMDQDGKQAELKSLKDKVQITVFFYTSCQYACPLMVKDLQRIDKDIPAALKPEIHFALFSVDPKTDTVEELKKYGESRGLDFSRWKLFTTSDPENVRELSALVGVRYKRTTKKDFSHSNVITVLDREGVIKYQQEGLNKETKDTVQAVLRAAARR